MLQVDFANAFNCLDHTHFLTVLKEFCQDLLPWAHWCYSKPTPLHLRNGESISSTRGVQQGDPLGHLLFAVGLSAVTKAVVAIQGTHFMCYLDDVREPEA